MRIWANHAHVFPKDVREEGTIEKLLWTMEACEIEKAVAFAPFAHQVKDAGIDPNAWLAKELKKHQDRLLGFGTIDFSAGKFADQVKRAHDFGFRGLKLHPPAQNFHILSDSLHEVYKEAEKLHLFLTFHTGLHWSRLREFRTLDFDEIAFSYPSLRFSLEHVGGYSFFHETVAVIQNHGLSRPNGQRGNVFAGLTSVFSPEAPHWFLDPQAMEELVFRIGARHIIFGLDFPYNDKRALRDSIGMIKGLRISKEAKEEILGGNLRAVLD